MLSSILTKIIEFQRNVALNIWLNIILVLAAPLLTILTYFALQPIQGDAVNLRYILTIDLIYVLFITTLVVVRVMRIISARRSVSAGAKLHLRLTTIFGFLALVPTVLVALFAILTVNQALEGWFSDRVSSAVGASLKAAESYKLDQRTGLENDTSIIARTLNRERRLGRLPDIELRPFLGLISPQLERGLKEIFIIDGAGKLIARGPNSYLFNFEMPNQSDFTNALGAPNLIEDFANNELRGLMKLTAFADHYIYVAREVDGSLMSLLGETAETALFYKQLELESGRLLFDFGLLYLIFAVILIMTATWVGLWFAERLSKPIGLLASAAQQVGAGDLDVKVLAINTDDEIATLGIYFNQMTEQLKEQRDDLIENAETADRRRRLFDSVLSSITSGVIGIDIDGNITFINRSAHRILMIPDDTQSGALETVVPEFENLFDKLRNHIDNVMFDDVKLIRRGKQENLLIRMATRENEAGEAEGYVIAFEDVTDLVSAQRMAAWGDVARRIAHEIKNPLTPIKLSAERIKRKFAPMLADDSDQLEDMTAVIVRQTDDLRRIVDEFSKFARMPEPDKTMHSLNQVLHDAVALQDTQQQSIAYDIKLPTEDITLYFDDTLVKQALINLLKNAGESVFERMRTQPDPAGVVQCVVREAEQYVEIKICDNGKGLPPDRARLFEPYVTHRESGTGLGLPIVLKIIEDHGGTLTLDDYYFEGMQNNGAMAIIRLPKINNEQQRGVNHV